VIFDGFLKLESLDFWMTPSPNEIVREKSGAKHGGKKRQKAAMNLLQWCGEICRSLPPYDTGSCRHLPHSRPDFISF
jgi:hypothetical protein